MRYDTVVPTNLPASNSTVFDSFTSKSFAISADGLHKKRFACNAEKLSGQVSQLNKFIKLSILYSIYLVLLFSYVGEDGGCVSLN